LGFEIKITLKPKQSDTQSDTQSEITNKELSSISSIMQVSVADFKKATGVDRFKLMLEMTNMDVKPHQLSGVQWMLEKETNPDSFEGVLGGINADEMGLGKTIMMIGTIISNFKARTLIVVPFALLDQWTTELLRITGHHPLVYHGLEKRNYGYKEVAAAPIVLTTYGHVHFDEEERSILHKIRWDRVVCDEAHHMRNSKSKAFNGVKMLITTIRWLLTGTPIQNSKKDLHSLLDILGFSPFLYTDEDTISEIIDEFVLKRTKEEAGVILPKKSENLLTVNWENEAERKLAQDVHSRLKFSGVNQQFASHSGYGKNTLVALLRARQVCVMPELITPGISKAIKDIDEGVVDSDDEDMDEEELLIIGKKERKTLMSIANNIAHVHEAGISSKIKAVCEEMKKNKGNGKHKLVFCQFRREIDRVEELLTTYGFRTASVDGRTPIYLRDEYLKSKEIDVLILQIQTGCEGLNLQIFSEVYFVTPHWNPAVEDQAVARCHRIGQKSQVDVYRFEMANFGEETKSLECHARNIQESKRELYEMFD
tara:strand:+ start:406 stop:2025 length:1620 start_codon:yes stop_codon:yes gene_type:complete